MESLPSRPNSWRRRALSGALALLMVALGVAPASAGESPQGDAAVPWPVPFPEYTYADSSSISDVQDNNPGHSDIWAGPSDTLPSVFFASDGSNALFRVRVRDDPDKKGGLESTVYLVSIGVGGTQAAVVGLNGKPASVDYVYTGNADGSVTRQIYTTPFTNDGSGTSAGARWSAAPDGGFFVDFQVPIAQITAVAPSVTATTPIQLYFGTSQAANLSVINKDYMIGGAVSYVGLATVTLNGAVVASPPVAADDTDTVDEDTSVLIDLVANDSDPDGDLDPTSLLVSPGPGNGSIVNNGDGTVTYTPDPDFNGADSFSYTVCDGGGLCDSATVSVTVDPVNDPPLAAADPVTTPEDSPITTDVLANDSDPDGDALSVSSYDATSTAGGTVSCTGAGNCDYTPPPDFSGTDTFTYTADDGNGGTATATVTVTVVGVNDAPLAVDDPVGTPEDTPLGVPVIGNDFDAEGDTLSIDFFTQPADGTVVDSGGGILTYTPDPDFNGSDSFTYRVCDDGVPALCDEATVSVTVTPANDPPVANDDGGATDEDVMTTIDVVANDSDIDVGDTLTVVGFDAISTAGGTVSCTGAGICDYTPALNHEGPDSFTYTVSDGTASVTATVSLTVGGVNDPPSAGDDSATVGEDTPTTITAATLVGNDPDPDGPLPLTITAVTNGAHGTVTIVGGDVLYSPDPDYNGPDTFTYTVCDGNVPAGCDTATVSVTVTPANDPPVANDDTATTDEDTPAVIAVLTNDSDIDVGDTLTVAGIPTPPLNGTAVISGGGTTITYTPALNFFGIDEFQYEISDGNGGTATAWARFVTVNPVNDAPDADDDTASVDEDDSVTVAVLGNDSDVDDVTLTVAAAGPAANGTVTVNGDNTVTYTPDPDYSGPDTFTYTVCDGGGLCDTASVSITVDAVNDAPDAGDDLAIMAEDGSTTVVVLANDGDVDGDPLTVTAAGPAANGTVTVNGDNTITYTPDPDYNGSDSFTYTIDDGNGGIATATVAVTVTAVNDTPFAGDDTVVTSEDGTIVIAVLANDGDVDGDPLAVTLGVSPSHGTVTLNGDGTISYIPDSDYHGPDAFTYLVDDGHGAVATASVSLTVEPVNDDPTVAGETVAVDEDDTVTFAPLTNDSDIDGDILAVTAVTAPGHGTVTVNGDGTLTYSPAPNFSGTDSFTYTVCDDAGGCSQASVTVNVAPVNDAPLYLGDAEIQLSGAGTPAPLEIGEADGDTYVLTVMAGELPPGLTLNPDGTWSGVPTVAGIFPVTIQACDPAGACSTFSLVLSVAARAPASFGASTSESLPVTGFGVIPLLVIGLIMVAIGGVGVELARDRAKS